MSEYVQKLFKTSKNPNCVCPGTLVFELNDPGDSADGKTRFFRAELVSVVETGTASNPCYNVNYKFPKSYLAADKQEIFDFCSMIKAWSCDSLAIRYAEEHVERAIEDGLIIDGIDDGVRVIVGSGPPSDGAGTDGQLYLDVLNKDWYGPKLNGSWSGTGPYIIDSGGAPTPPAGTEEDKTAYAVGTHVVSKPVGATTLFVKLWGPGGSDYSSKKGGVGGYTQGVFDVTSETNFTLVVGAGSDDREVPSAYTGLFFGSITVGLARLLAGGGGAAGRSNGIYQHGYPGNYPGKSGGYNVFEGEPGGAASSVPYGAGGGGYVGGIKGRGGYGGTSYAHSSVTDPLLLNGSPGDLTAPNHLDSDYAGVVGQSEQDGYAVLQWLS